jgi:FkbM family methyltransferase
MSVFNSVPKPLRRIHWKYRLLLWQLHRHFGASITLQTKQGIFRLPLDANDSVSRHLFSRREFELDLISNSLSFLREQGKCPRRGTGTVLDIGANNGVISIGMLATGQFERAIAVEPDPRNFSLLCENVKANGFEDRFTCLNYAASDDTSTLEFELSEGNYGDHRIRNGAVDSSSKELFNESKRRTIRVDSDRVDNLLERTRDSTCVDPSLVWIDVQGYEGFAFRGARTLLSKDIPVMAEIWPYGIARTGMSQADFCDIVSEAWSTYWIERRDRFVPKSIRTFAGFLNQVGSDGDYQNVIFTK